MEELRVAGGEMRASQTQRPGIRGYAAVFNQLSDDLGGFRERILPGAFKDCLAGSPDVRALWNHSSNFVLGRTRAKTLRLSEDSKGLNFDCDLPDTQTARDLLASIERGDVDQCSFGFYVLRQKWSRDAGDGLIRELQAIHLLEISPVTFPAYSQTSLDTRRGWASIPKTAGSRSLHAILEADCQRDLARLRRLEPFMERLAR